MAQIAKLYSVCCIFSCNDCNCTVHFRGQNANIWVGSPAARAADCKSATLDTSKVRVLPGPPFPQHLRIFRCIIYASVAQMVEQRPEEPLVGVSKAPGGTTWRHGRSGEDTGLSIRRLRVRFPLASPFFNTYKKSSFGIQMSFFSVASQTLVRTISKHSFYCPFAPR